MPLDTVQGATVVVLGGTGSVGCAVARAFAQAGAHVVVADLDEVAAKDLAAELGGTGMQVDVRDLASVQALAGRVDSERRGAHVVCSTTLSEPDPTPWRQASLSTWTTVRGTDVNGVVHAQLAFLPGLLRARGPRHLLNTTTMAGYLPGSHPGAIGAAHAAVIAITEVSRVDLAKTSVGVSLLCAPTDVSALPAVAERAVEQVTGVGFLAAAPATPEEAAALRERHGAIRRAFQQ